MPELKANLLRSHTRTNKTFDKHLLDDTIRFTNEAYRKSAGDDWIVVDNTAISVDETVELLLQNLSR
jgi:hypothetical protein